MAKLLLGKEVNAALNADILSRCRALCAKGIQPTLAIVRCGERPDDLSYERGAKKRAEALEIAVRSIVLSENVTEDALLETIDTLNVDDAVHGVLVLRPLPKHLREAEESICNRLDPKKDVDGMTDASMAGVFLGKPQGFAPCTPAACMQILDHYGIDCEGKRALVIGRSAVVGKPLSMMLLKKHATVTVAHTKTKDLPALAKQADILITSAGKLRSLTEAFVSEGQTVIDVSINWDEAKGGIAGDAVFDAVEPMVDAITPVPGGVGAVTTSVLMLHVVEAAECSIV